ncbi:putative membrane protein YhdT [Pseudomonas citronellolis]|uniref:hypothetical protein n=1 Tax=Pseudomonas citronellolis TaxID=53408 RepID=UPI0020A14B6E|nr:hypothetical protein [Pseudomonas citronellolis]MCP1645650.1 putative membrane protein YhdT [Pseudomonas citronellolis]MCP1667478.1 putative membrane protein YhdT [Pseudomonas citronellolis]MCP1699922.1 putative membrane protein YhdT [Pseudomonas citronellolis]MCP1705364.1 putative membrane protein YhdT [Pseudomonas citronellolis]MCP1800046.1 putative membrane protein YhdT [Pseudomonas citronellolis]
MNDSITQPRATWLPAFPLRLEASCLSLGLLGGWLFAQSAAGLVGLVPLSIGLAWALVRLAISAYRQCSAALCFCGGIAACSSKLAEIVSFYTQGQRSLAFSEIPELFICVVLPPLIAMILVLLVNLVLND